MPDSDTSVRRVDITFTVSKLGKSKPPEVRRMALQLYLEGLNLRGIIQVELNDKTLPCYFIPAKKDKVCPVIFLVTGGEGSSIEMYFWMGAYALKNGYSVFFV